MDGIGVLDRGVGERELALVACLVGQNANEDEQDDREAVTNRSDSQSGESVWCCSLAL